MYTLDKTRDLNLKKVRKEKRKSGRDIKNHAITVVGLGLVISAQFSLLRKIVTSYIVCSK
jgi:hypothetical protein